MKAWTARAFQIACMESEQISTLHAKEKKVGHTLANWNIQLLFNLPTIASKFAFPNSLEDLTQHVTRVENDLEKSGFVNRSDDQSSLDWLHSFDWTIYNNRGKIVWNSTGPSGYTSAVHRLKKDREQST